MADANPASCALLRAHGIDPHEVLLSGWDRDGYTTFIRDERGETIPKGDHELTLQRHEWPDGFDYEALLNAWATDRPHG